LTAATGGGRVGWGVGWQTSAERPARALAGEMLDKDTQDPVEVTRSEDQ
jgi:hypothetical protein